MRITRGTRFEMAVNDLAEVDDADQLPWHVQPDEERGEARILLP